MTDDNHRAKNVLVTGDVILDHHIYMGERTTHDSPHQLGSWDHNSLGGSKLLFDILKAVADLPENENRKRLESFKKQIESIAKTYFLEIKDESLAEQQRENWKNSQFDLFLNSRVASASSSRLHVEFGLDVSKTTPFPTHLNGYAIWKPFNAGQDKKGKVWRIDFPLGYGDRPTERPEFLGKAIQAPTENPEILVLDDAGLDFRFEPSMAVWPAVLTSDHHAQPEWVVLKMSGPLCRGKLWETVHKKFQDRLVVVVSINDVRRERIKVSQRGSWEKTALELRDELLNNSSISGLLACQHLIVGFGTEGALYVDNSNKDEPRYRLIFDSSYMEGMLTEQLEGDVFGSTSCLTAAVVNELSKQKEKMKFEQGIKSGLSAMRTMRHEGHGDIYTTARPGYPFQLIAKEIDNPTEHYITATLPDQTVNVSCWSIIGADRYRTTGDPEPLYGIAKGVALLGTKALNHVPHASFGNLYTVDRNEIESLNTIRNLVQEYINNDDGKKPLSLGVFGPPGSGKSFSIKQIVKDLKSERAAVCEFNLSQFHDLNDLIGAFHQIRDIAIQGSVPFVFWDEFDSQDYKWLQYLLAPMQDGSFQSEQITHPIGKCVFIFAGGTSYDMQNFGPASVDELKDEDREYLKANDPDRLHEMRRAHAEFKLRKGPDFKSRLSGFLNVLGPNRKQSYNPQEDQWNDDMTDVCFPVRRALFLRVLLGHYKAQKLKIDRGLLTAFLEVGRFKHGARSLEKIVQNLEHPGSAGPTRSDLPSAEIMELHVDSAEFMKIMNRVKPFDADIEKLAASIHRFWWDLSKHPVKGWQIAEEYDRPYDDLTPKLKADNQEVAKRIPSVLELVGLSAMRMTNPDDPNEKTDSRVLGILEKHIELLSEAEHDGWMEYKQLTGWIRGDRDSDKKMHPGLVPYQELTDHEKQKDRDAVRHYPDVLENVKYKIVVSDSGP